MKKSESDKKSNTNLSVSRLRIRSIFLIIFEVLVTLGFSLYMIWWEKIKNIQLLVGFSLSIIFFGIIYICLFLFPLNSLGEINHNHSTYYSSVTGLPGKMLFNDRLGQYIVQSRDSKSFTVVMILDVDKFKSINETFGRSIGDLLVKEIAERLLKYVDDKNTVGHLAEDEFAFIFPEVNNIYEAAAIATNILNIISKPFYIMEQEIYITGSIGISLHPIDGNDPQNIIKNTYEAVKSAKQQGRNNYKFYTDALSSLIVEHTAMKNGLIKALQRDEFVLHYQPQINLETGMIEGAEVLIRWMHPSLGLIIPGKFLSIAEETGMMPTIGEWVLRCACEQNKRWQEMGLSPICISVNISTSQLEETGFIEIVEKILKETEANPEYIELDLQESTIFDFENSSLLIENLKKMGFKIAIDDFGTGYSSLKYLSRLLVDRIKIDKIFIQNITDASKRDTIASSIISIGHSINGRVLAVGVENEEQLLHLKNNGCDSIQGFYFSEAVERERFEVMVRDNWHLRDNIIYHS